MHRLVALGTIALKGCAIESTQVRAANPDFCRDYANAAVNQACAAWNNWRCRRGAEPPRWSTAWRDHYNWCLGAYWENARREREFRREHLERCRYR
jgi:hypothetical protein